MLTNFLSSIIFILYKYFNHIIILLLFSIFLLDYAHFGLNIIPRQATWIIDIISISTILLLLFSFSINKCINISIKYIILILAMLAFSMIGCIINGSDTIKLISGLRFYFRALPFFFLPSLYRIEQKQFKTHLLIVLALMCIQAPIAIYQRLFQFRGLPTGDVITGTVGISSILSILIICCLAILFSFYLNKEITFFKFFFISLFLFIPATINETKGTLLLMPIAFLVPALNYHGNFKKKVKYIFSVLFIISILTAIYVPIYDHFMQKRLGHSVVIFFQNEKELRNYLYRGGGEDRDFSKHIGRFDAIEIAYDYIKKDPIRFLIGIGLGNTTMSILKSENELQNEVFKFKPQMLALTTISYETGFVGLILYLTFYYFLYKESKRLYEKDNIYGKFALGWSSVVIIMGFSMIYKNTFQFDTLQYLFMYFSGSVAANNYSIRKDVTYN